MPAAQNLSPKDSTMGIMWLRASLIALISMGLAACGSGSSTGTGNISPGGTPAAPVAPVDPAVSAQLTAEFAIATNALTLNWKDVFPSGTNYRVQSRNADGSDAFFFVQGSDALVYRVTLTP